MHALVSTRKGLMVFEKRGSSWKLGRTHFDGVKNSFSIYDPVHKCIWAGMNHGHWGAKLHISTNKGKTFEEIAAPKFSEGGNKSLKDFWALTTTSKGRTWLGVEPGALFYSDDRGKNWSLCQGLTQAKGYDQWMSGGTDGSCVHSILINPGNEDHIVIGVSVAGVLETRDGGKSWGYITKGLKGYYMPDPDAEIGQDPHMIAMAPSDPNVLWQQHHCGIFKSENMGQTWTDLSKTKGLKSAFGWGIVVDEKDSKVAYTVPALSDETRIPVNRKLIVQRTKNGGKSWEAITKGLPKSFSYDIVYRNALALKDKDLMFGSTTGNLFFSSNKGNSWKRFDGNLPPIYSVKLF